MATATGPGCDPGIAYGAPQIPANEIITISPGDAISLPLTWWQTPPVFGQNGETVVTPGVPVNMTGMTPYAEFLTYGQAPWGGTPLTVSSFVPTAGTWKVTGPGHGQPGDLTSGLPLRAASPAGPRIRSYYTDAAGPHTLGTFYLSVQP